MASRSDNSPPPVNLAPIGCPAYVPLPLATSWAGFPSASCVATSTWKSARSLGIFTPAWPSLITRSPILGVGVVEGLSLVGSVQLARPSASCAASTSGLSISMRGSTMSRCRM